MAKAKTAKRQTSKGTAKATPAPEVAKPKATRVAPVRRVPTQATINRLRAASEKAKAIALEKNPELPKREVEAIAGIEQVKAIVGTQLHKEGKLSPLGHKANCENGQLDIAILTTPLTEGMDFNAWIEAVAKAGCPSRKTPVTDNAGLVNRLLSHFKHISGLKNTSSGGERVMRKRLAGIGLADRADEIMAGLVPACNLFKDMVKAAKY